MLFLKQPLILPLPYNKSATTCHNDSSKVLKSEIIEDTAPPQWPHKRGTIILGHPVFVRLGSWLKRVIPYVHN